MNKGMILFLLFTLLFFTMCSSRDEKGRKLIEAIEKGNLEEAVSLAGGDLNTALKNKRGRSALALAFEKKHAPLIKGIIEAGGCLDEEDIKENDLLFASLCTNEFEFLSLYMEAGGDINIRNSNGESLLFKAIEQDDMDTTKELIFEDINVNFKNNEGLTALDKAAQKNEEAALFLIRMGANFSGSRGIIPLRDRLDEVFYSENIIEVKWYIDTGFFGPHYDPVWLCFLLTSPPENSSYYKEAVKLMMQAGIHMTDIYAGAGTILNVWITSNDIEMIRLLLTYGKSDINRKDSVGCTALDYAYYFGTQEIIDLFTEAGGKHSGIRYPIDRFLEAVSIDDYGTVRQFLSSMKDIDNNDYLFNVKSVSVLTLLLDNGADINTREYLDCNLLSHFIPEFHVWYPDENYDAEYAENAQCIKYLLEKGIEITSCSLRKAISTENNELAWVLIDSGVDIDGFFEYGYYFDAIKKYHDKPSEELYTVLQYIFENTKKINSQGKNYNWTSRMTPLTYAVLLNEPRLVALLLAHGADINAKNPYGKTPVFYLAQHPWETVRDYLHLFEEKGVDYHVKDNTGLTCLDYAFYYQNEAAINAFKEKQVESKLDMYRKEVQFIELCSRSGVMDKIAGYIQPGFDINFSYSVEGKVYNGLRNAIHRKNYDLVELLIKNGADINISLEKGMNPFMLAADKYRDDRDFGLLKLLINNGARVNEQDDYGKTAFSYLPFKWYFEGDNRIEHFDTLLNSDLHISVNPFGDRDKQLLKRIIDLVDDYRTIQALFMSGLDIFFKNESGGNILHSLISHYSYKKDDEPGYDSDRRVLHLMTDLVAEGIDPYEIDEYQCNAFDYCRSLPKDYFLLKDMADSVEKNTDRAAIVSLQNSGWLEWDEDYYFYHPARVFDGKETTGWLDGSNDTGIDDFFTLELDRELSIDEIEVLPGYFDKRWWKDNNRVKTLKAEFDNGPTENLRFTDEMKPQKTGLKKAVSFKSVTFTIKDVHRAAKSNDTALSEIRFYKDGKQVVLHLSRVGRYLTCITKEKALSAK